MGMFGAKTGSIAGFNPSQPSFLDKIGLVGDVLTGNPITKNRLDEDFAFQQAQYQAQHPAPVKVSEGDTYIDPLTGHVVFSGPAKLPAIAQNAQYLNSQVPGAGDTYLHNFAQNGGGQGPGVITVNGQQYARPTSPAAAPEPPAEAIATLRKDPSKAPYFDQTFGAGASSRYLGGGAAPATGPAGFPLYPSGH